MDDAWQLEILLSWASSFRLVLQASQAAPTLAAGPFVAGAAPALLAQAKPHVAVVVPQPKYVDADLFAIDEYVHEAEEVDLGERITVASVLKLCQSCPPGPAQAARDRGVMQQILASC